MNAIGARLPAPAEAEAMADIVISAPELDRITRERAAEYARLRRRERWRNTGKNATILAQWGVIAGLMAFIAVRPPQTEPVPIIVYQREDGTFTNYARWETLPRQVREDTTVNVVWNYVQQRESWSEGNADWAWTVVSAMSSTPVRDAFQAWFRADNPESPARRYRDGTTVQVRYLNWDRVCPEGGCQGPPDAYRIWFERLETPPRGQPAAKGTYAVTVRIRRNVPIPTDRMWQRWTFNAPQIQVVEYLGPMREGVTR